MAYELMIPEAAEVPAHIRDPEVAKKANEEAAAGISTGFPSRVKLSGKQFTLVDGNGVEMPFPATKLVPGPDGNIYLPLFILRAKKELIKTWYAQAFNPKEEAQAPDCFSSDGIKPDASVTTPQCDVCANCAMNAFGSGKDQNGNPTAGKACADAKILAVFVPGFGVHSFKIPPASLKNFGLFVKKLTAASIPVGNIKTLVGFDLTATYPILIFQFGGYAGEEVIGKLAVIAESAEVDEIINIRAAVVSQPTKLVTEVVAEPEKPEPKKRGRKKAAEKSVEKPVDELGMEVEVKAEVVEEGVEDKEGDPSDADILAELGL